MHCVCQRSINHFEARNIGVRSLESLAPMAVCRDPFRARRDRLGQGKIENFNSLFDPKNGSRIAVRMANCLKQKRVVNIEDFTILVRCGAMQSDIETTPCRCPDF
jgi:hypothetical protein